MAEITEDLKGFQEEAKPLFPKIKNLRWIRRRKSCCGLLAISNNPNLSF
jgi:hypothetical protein